MDHQQPIRLGISLEGDGGEELFHLFAWHIPRVGDYLTVEHTKIVLGVYTDECTQAVEAMEGRSFQVLSVGHEFTLYFPPDPLQQHTDQCVTLFVREVAK